MLKTRLTIFTPTFNRGYTIHKCYESLCRQTNKEFIWIIVDDGSTDNTEEIINSFIYENKVDINYIKQVNGGKHVAHNTAVLNCRTEFFVCLDSDDYLTDNAVQIIYDNLHDIIENETIAGLLGLKGKSLNKPLRSWLPENVNRTSISDLYSRYKFKGETILVFKTSVLIRYLFPVFEDEKFVTEAVIYDRISLKYEMKLLNRVLYLCEYLNDGYTKNISITHKNNPKGYMYYHIQKIEMSKGIKEKYNAISHFIAGCLSIQRYSYFRSCENKLLKYVCIPSGMWIFLKPIIKKQLVRFKLIEE